MHVNSLVRDLNHHARENGKNDSAFIHGLICTLDSHTELWTNKSNREVVINYFVSRGVMFMLDGNNIESTAVFALPIVAFESCDTLKYSKVDFVRLLSYGSLFGKHRDVIRGCEQSAIQFFCRRIPCSCCGGQQAR